MSTKDPNGLVFPIDDPRSPTVKDHGAKFDIPDQVDPLTNLATKMVDNPQRNNKQNMPNEFSSTLNQMKTINFEKNPELKQSNHDSTLNISQSEVNRSLKERKQLLRDREIQSMKDLLLAKICDKAKKNKY